jgi:hypothetical protein
MINKILSRIISGGIWAIFVGLLMDAYHAHGQQMGKEEFLAKEAARYDRHYMHPGPVILEIIGCMVLFYIIFAIYEAMAFVIFKILEKINPSANN